MRIFCPKCEWEPHAFDLWACDPSCGQEWNTFDTRGQCPACGKVWRQTQCPVCDRWSEHEDWYHEDVSNFQTHRVREKGERTCAFDPWVRRV